ncbi:MAG: tetratricopeptide repeat protein [Planctomycetota bacterium]
MRSLLTAFLLGLSSALPAGTALAQGPPPDWNERGVQALEKGDLEAAIHAFQEARSLEPENPVVRLNLARAYGHQARALLDQGSLDAALSILAKGIAVDRDGGSLELLVARIRLQQGDPERAGALLKKLQADFPGNAAVLALAAELAALKGDLEGSVALMENAVRLDPDRAAFGHRLEQLKEEQRAWKGFLTDSSAHFDFRFDPNRPSVVRAVPHLIHDLEDAYGFVVKQLGLAPPDRILVLVLDRQRYRSAAPDWSGGLYDGRIRIVMNDYAAEEERIRATLRHEYTHAVLHRLGAPLPTWLHEGLAQWVEGRSLEAARGWLHGHRELWPDPAELSGSWTGWKDRNKVAAAYAYAFSLAVRLEEQFGPSAYSLLFEHVRRSGFEAGFRETFAVSVADFEKGHQDWLESK